MPSRARTAGNRISGTLRQDPDADVTGLRHDLAGAKAVDGFADWLKTCNPTPEEFARRLVDAWTDAGWEPWPDLVAEITRIASPEAAGR